MEVLLLKGFTFVRRRKMETNTVRILLNDEHCVAVSFCRLPRCSLYKSGKFEVAGRNAFRVYPFSFSLPQTIPLFSLSLFRLLQKWQCVTVTSDELTTDPETGKVYEELQM